MLPKYRCDRRCLIMASGAKPRQPAESRPYCDLAPLLFSGQWLVGLVVGRLERQIRLLRSEYGRLRARVQEAGCLHFLMARQVIERRQAEMLEEEVGGAPGDGLAGRSAAAHRPDPVLLEQQVERSLAQTDAAHLLDLSARHRL